MPRYDSYRWLFTLLLLAATAACRQAEPITRTVAVAPATIPCAETGEPCLLVSTDVTAGWQTWADPIEGFTFEPGSYYQLQVIETAVEDANTDADARRWTLEAQLAQEPATIQTEWISADQVPCAEMEDGRCFQVWNRRYGGWQLVPHEIEGYAPLPGLVTQLTFIDRETDRVWTALQVLDRGTAPPTPAPLPTAAATAVSVPVTDVTALTFQPMTLPEIGVRSVVPQGWEALAPRAWSGADGFVNVSVEAGASSRAAIDRLAAAMTAADGPAVQGEIIERELNGRVWTLYARAHNGQQLTVAATTAGGSVILISLSAAPAQHAAILQAMLTSFEVSN